LNEVKEVNDRQKAERTMWALLPLVAMVVQLCVSVAAQMMRKKKTAHTIHDKTTEPLALRRDAPGHGYDLKSNSDLHVVAWQVGSVDDYGWRDVVVWEVRVVDNKTGKA
jgi:hypothetical protein